MAENANTAKSADKSATATEETEWRGSRRTLVGRVKSAKMQKTVVVEVVRSTRHPVYGKYVRVRTRYKAHDEQGQYKQGDLVEIREHRPISREKRWMVIRLIERPAEA